MYKGTSGSANAKIVSVNDKLGFRGISKQQGTSRAIYDTIKLDATTNNSTIRFFENVNTRQFPFTNITENKLQVGESLAIQRFSLSIVNYDPSTKTVRSQNPIGFFGNLAGLYRSDISVSIAQDQVIKKLPVHTMHAPFNKNSKFIGISQVGQTVDPTLTSFELPHDVFHLDNNIIIPPQIEFFAELQLPPINVTNTATNEFYMCLTLEGLGSLYSPKSNY